MRATCMKTPDTPAAWAASVLPGFRVQKSVCTKRQCRGFVDSKLVLRLRILSATFSDEEVLVKDRGFDMSCWVPPFEWMTGP